jgi:hypothetical protein
MSKIALSSRSFAQEGESLMQPTDNLDVLISLLSLGGMVYRVRDPGQLADLLDESGIDVSAGPAGTLDALWQALQEVSPKAANGRPCGRGELQ